RSGPDPGNDGAGPGRPDFHGQSAEVQGPRRIQGRAALRPFGPRRLHDLWPRSLEAAAEIRRRRLFRRRRDLPRARPGGGTLGRDRDCDLSEPQGAVRHVDLAGMAGNLRSPRRWPEGPAQHRNGAAGRRSGPAATAARSHHQRLTAMQVLRTPDERFANLEGYGFEPHYATVTDADGTDLRIHYVDEGPRGRPPILLMHGNPTWAYLYRK